MKKMIYLLLCFLINTQLSFSQYQFKDTSKIKFVFIINSYGRPPIITSNDFIDRSAFEYSHFLHGPQYDQMLKMLKATSVGIEQVKQNIKLLTLVDLFNLYYITPKYRHCKVMYDDGVIDFPETLVATSKQITNVKVVKTSKGYFIDIIGIDYKELKEMEEAKKRGEPFVG